MKVLILFVAIFTLHHHSARGQTRITLDARNRVDTTKVPLILIDTFRTDLSHLLLSPQNIVSISILKDSAAKSKFAEAGKNRVVMIAAKPRTTFLRIDNILNEYMLSVEDRKLRICVNKTLMRNPQLLLIDKSEIELVEITTDRHWTNSEDANSCEKFINVVTVTKGKSGLWQAF